MPPRKPVNLFVLTVRTLVVLALAVLLGLGVYAAIDTRSASFSAVDGVEHAEGGGRGQGWGGGRGEGRGGGHGEGRFAASSEKAAAQATSDFLMILAWILAAIGVEIVIVKLIKRHSAARRAAVLSTSTNPGA